MKKRLENNSGFTIIEGLIGMVVASILLAAISPILVMSTAIRVQSKRIEMASQTARTFIDGVRVGSITKPEIVSQLNSTQNSPRNLAYSANDYLINTSEMPAPRSRYGLYCVNNNSIIDNRNCRDSLFYIQAGRIVQTTAKNDGYRLAIRVYRGDIDFNQPIKINTGKTQNNNVSPLSAGLGDKQAPIIEMTTDIGNSSTDFYALCQRLGSSILTDESAINCK